MQADRVATCVEQVRGGHELIQSTTAEIRSWWEQCRGATTPPFQELSRRILELRELLRVHFQDEESADHTLGVDDLPAPSNERAILLSYIDQLIMRLRVCHLGMDGWADAELAIARFLEKLSTHESRELATLPDVGESEVDLKWSDVLTRGR
jgi:hypothetical protein